MKRIKILKWKEKNPKGELVEVGTINLINSLLNIGLAKQQLIGVENMQKLQRINQSIIDAQGKDEIVFDDADLELIKGFLDYAPATWGLSKDVMKAIDIIRSA